MFNKPSGFSYYVTPINHLQVMSATLQIYLTLQTLIFSKPLVSLTNQ